MATKFSRPSLVSRLSGDTSGSVAIIFAAVLIPVMGIVSAAIDYGRAAKVRSTLQTAVSSAAQAGSAHLHDDRSVIEAQVKAMLKANLPAHLAELPHKVMIPNDRSKIEVAMEASVPTMLMAVVGLAEIGVEATGFARPAVATLGAGQAGGSPDAMTSDPGQAERRMRSAIGGGRQPASGGGFPALPQASDQEELKAAAREIADKLRALNGQLGGGAIAVPPGAEADIERMLRDIRRSMR